MPIIKDLVKQKSTIYIDKWSAYDGLILEVPSATPNDNTALSYYTND